MIRRRLLAWAPVAVIVGYGVLLVAQQAAPQGGTKVREAEPLVVAMCDGKTEVEVDGVKAGTKPDRVQAEGAARQLMAAWRVAHPEARWDEAEAETPAAQALPPAGEKKGERSRRKCTPVYAPR